MSYRWHDDCKKETTCEKCVEPCAEEQKKRLYYDPRDDVETEEDPCEDPNNCEDCDSYECPANVNGMYSEHEEPNCPT